MAKKMICAIKKIGGCMAKAWNASKMYISGGVFWINVFIALISVVMFITTSCIDGYHTLNAYSLLGTAFCPLLAIPLGLLWKLSYED